MDSQLLVTLFCALVLILAHHQYLTLFLVAYSIIRSRESEETANGAALQVVPPVSIRGPRTLWTKVRSNDWWERIVMMEFDDADWRENFRITRASFMKLCQMMERVMEPCQVTVRNPVPLGMRVAMVLYKLGSWIPWIPSSSECVRSAQVYREENGVLILPRNGRFRRCPNTYQTTDFGRGMHHLKEVSTETLHSSNHRYLYFLLFIYHLASSFACSELWIGCMCKYCVCPLEFWTLNLYKLFYYWCYRRCGWQSHPLFASFWWLQGLR